MKITIIAVGKLKEKYWRDALDEYVKRLSRFSSVNIVEVQEEYCPENPGDAIIEKVKIKEGERIINKIKDDSYTIILDLSGKMIDSVDFSEIIKNQTNMGKSNFNFIIGGSYGLSDEVLRKGDFILSLSKMTFPHQLARVIISEQIYRALKIINNETYHK